MRNFVEPEWNSVAAEYDGVHLTWLGFLLCEGLAIDLDDGDVAMLRNWCSERTLWLNPVLSATRPLPAPALSGRVCEIVGVDPADDPLRRLQDEAWLNHMLRRPPGPKRG
jgi:hypothetical protein